MRITIKILKGKPSRQDFYKIIKMICEGYQTGVDRPAGIIWNLKQDEAAYNHLQKLEKVADI